MKKLKKIINNKNGFTLIEILVVISAIGLLATIVLVSLNYAREKSNFAKIVGDLDQIAKAIELYNTSFGKYPEDKTPADVNGVSESITDNDFNGILENAPDIIPNYLPSWPQPPCSIQDYQYDYDNVVQEPYQYVRVVLKAPFIINQGGIKIDPWYGHLYKCLYTNAPNGYCGDGLNIESESLKEARFSCKKY